MNIIRQYRQLKGWTQKQLAEKLFVSVSLVTFWETGKRTPKDHHLEALAKVFGVDKEILKYA